MDLIIQSGYCKAIRNVRFNLLLLIYILINIFKNFTAIHFQLNWIDVQEVVILLMTYLVKHVFQIKQRRFISKRFQHGYNNK